MRYAMLAALVMMACATPPRPVSGEGQMSAASRVVRDRWVADIDSLARTLALLDTTIASWIADPRLGPSAVVQSHFRSARLAFKRIEVLAAYYEPSTTRSINGPALPSADYEEGPEVVKPAEGFQVIEELVFDDGAPDARVRAQRETQNVRALIVRLRTAASAQRMTDAHVFDAAKLEIARIVALGVTGFDSPVAALSLPESRAALDGIHVVFEPYRAALLRTHPATVRALDSLFVAADARLARGDFDRFNRLAFIAEAANPIAQALVAARQALEIGTPTEMRAFRMSAVTLFDSAAFDATAFAAPGSGSATVEEIALGESLFFDPVLSNDGSRSCASCHEPAKAFTDGRVRSASRSGHAVLRNAPTMLNAGLQVGTFYDLRTTYLEDQIADVLQNVEEMHGPASSAAERLARLPAYVDRFRTAYPSADSSATSGVNLRRAIAAYVRSLTSLNSRVDRAFRGDTTALSAVERQGLNLFMGKARCATCHFVPLFNGTVPPAYQESEVEVLGVPGTPAIRGARIDADSGRARVTRSPLHLYAFKTPTVRNVALTAPYMHNGVYATLEQVVDFYNRGGGAGIGIRLANQTLPADSLGLTKAEQQAVVRFLGALTDTAGVTAQPHPRTPPS